jgi:pyruvate dehydrogenase (quinone)/pyruvate oxidase
VKNNTLGQIKWEQMAFLGNPEYGVELHPIDYAMVAQACGGAGFTIDDPNNCGAILEKALATPGPVVVQVVVDTNEPLLPPKITREQALNFAEALAKGEPDRVKIAMSALQAKVREMI